MAGIAFSDEPEIIQEANRWLYWLKSVGLLSPAGIFLIVTTGILFWAIIDKERFDRFRHIVISLFTFIQWFRKQKVKGDFELNIERQRKELNDQIGKNILPYEPKINWVKETDRETFIKNNKVVIRLNYHDDKNKTLVAATLGYVRNSLLISARQYLPEDIMESTNLAVTKRLVENYGHQAINYLHTEILEPIFKERPEIKKRFYEFMELDNHAMFTQILLPELLEMGDLLYPRSYKPDFLAKEVSDLIDFLYTIASREHEQEVPLEHQSQLFSLSIVIVAKAEKLYSEGLIPYQTAVNFGISRGIKNIYILARGYKRKEAIKIGHIFEKQDNIQAVEMRAGKHYKPESIKPIDCICVLIRPKYSNKRNTSA